MALLITYIKLNGQVLLVCYQMSESINNRYVRYIYIMALHVMYQPPDILSGVHWIGLCSVLRPLQHSIGYMGDRFYRSKDPTNSIKVLKEMLQKTKQVCNNLHQGHDVTV